MSRPLRLDERKEHADAVDRAPQVDVDDPAPLFFRQRFDAPGGDDAGVVAHDVDGAERVERRVRQRSNVVEPGDVRTHADRVVSGLHELCCGGGGGGGVDVGDDHVHALGRETVDDRPTDARRASGDDSSPATKVVHGTVPGVNPARPPSTQRTLPVM